jgi:hypothetical protein
MAYSDMTSVQFVSKPKWGMGPIRHSGILTIGLAGGREREFILLGTASGEGIRDAILAKTSIRPC